MSRSIVAKRYAQALFEAAVEADSVAAVEQELRLVVELIEMNADFRKFLEHPNIGNDDKFNVLTTSLENHVSAIVMNTLRLIISRGREAMLGNLLGYYIAIANAALGQDDAIVYSATELSAEDLEQVAKTFSTITGKNIKVNPVVDPSILGGLRVRIGDHLYDGSLSTKLNKLEQSLVTKAL